MYRDTQLLLAQPSASDVNITGCLKVASKIGRGLTSDYLRYKYSDEKLSPLADFQNTQLSESRSDMLVSGHARNEPKARILSPLKLQFICAGQVRKQWQGIIKMGENKGLN